MNRRHVWLGLIGWILFCFAAAALGSLATTPQLDGWYRSLQKPHWHPPDSLFGPVWTLLYLLMAMAAWLIWKQGGFKENRRPLAWFVIQLILNVAWSWIFFAGHQTGWAVVELVCLWIAIFMTTVLFFKKRRLAGALLIPYLGWVTFAGCLNWTIWRLNAGI
ncbi:TspO/MBR family protein [Planctomicrobium sp. SH664]|uniref:TspO/MBR family protein n=1 Tax=Planctomicrobium sp. SH664 TaxID=3448125 RepID=UPI003F5B4BAB